MSINQIQVDSTVYDVKDSLSRPILIDRDSASTVTLPENLTLQGLVDEYIKGRPVLVFYVQKWYKLTNYTISSTTVSLTFLAVTGTTLSYFTATGSADATSVYIYGPTYNYIVQGTRSFISSALSRSTSSAGTGTIPTGYSQGFLTMWGRPNASNTGYMSVCIPLNALSSTATSVIFADDTNQITYNVTKSSSTVTFAFVSASSSTAAIDAVYITP